MNYRIKSMVVIVTLILTSLSFPVLTDAVAVQGAQARRQAVVYTCPMDGDVKSAKPGKCPKCGMDLRVARAEDKSAEADSQVSSTATVSNVEGEIKLSNIPDTTVYDQDGRRLNFYSDLVKGKTVAINFIFTSCTTICPPLTATFRKLQQELGERAGRDVQLISISVDPTTDVPERLKSFAAKFNAGPGWTFVTGSKPDIDSLLRALGAWANNKNDHTPMILVGNDEAGRWTRTYGLATAATLVKVVSEAASISTTASADVKVPMPGLSKGGAINERQVERRSVNEVMANEAMTTVAVSSNRPLVSAPESKVAEKKAAKRDQAAAAYFTNTLLLTQENKAVQFYDDLLKDKIVLINFIFTSCKGVCSPMTANLLKVQQYLGDRVGKDINMITISVDPTVDTPEVLRKYTSDFKVKPGWHFLTGSKENIATVLRKLGGFVDNREEHSTVLLVGNMKTGEWVKLMAMHKPSQIADAVASMALPGAQ